MRDIINSNRSHREFFNRLFCEKLLASVVEIFFLFLKKKKDCDPTISAVTNIHTRFYIQIHEYPSTPILAAALVSQRIMPDCPDDQNCNKRILYTGELFDSKFTPDMWAGMP